MELYDLKNDPEEVHNILELPPDIAQTFSRRLTKRFKGELWFR